MIENPKFVPFKIKRDGFPPLTFTGIILSTSNDRIRYGNQQHRWTTITIYRTKGNKIIVKTEIQTCWEGETDHVKASSFSTASEVIEFMKGWSGQISSVAQSAIEEASKIDSEFESVYVEHVD